MPEYVEIKMESDKINKLRGKRFNKVTNHEGHRSGDIDIPYTLFRIEAESKGKELKLTFFDLNSESTTSYMFGMGMAGGFHIGSEPPKYVRACFYGSGNEPINLYLSDKRNFAFWKKGTWNPSRSPDPLQTPKDWWNNIIDNLHKRAFDKPIYEVLMNQAYFNGIGNYLRAEILGIIDADPFVSARDYITEYGDDLFRVTCIILSQTYAYKTQLGLTYDGKEPFLKFYKKGAYLDDSGNRRFWFDSKWTIPNLDENGKLMLRKC